MSSTNSSNLYVVYPHTNDPPSLQKSSEKMPAPPHPDDLTCDDRTGPGFLPNGLDLDARKIKDLGYKIDTTTDETCANR